MPLHWLGHQSAKAPATRTTREGRLKRDGLPGQTRTSTGHGRVHRCRPVHRVHLWARPGCLACPRHRSRVPVSGPCFRQHHVRTPHAPHLRALCSKVLRISRASLSQVDSSHNSKEQAASCKDQAARTKQQVASSKQQVAPLPPSPPPLPPPPRPPPPPPSPPSSSLMPSSRALHPRATSQHHPSQASEFRLKWPLFQQKTGPKSGHFNGNSLTFRISSRAFPSASHQSLSSSSPFSQSHRSHRISPKSERTCEAS